MKTTFLALALFSLTAHAEVKPSGTIQLSQCGTLNKQTEVCIANVVDSDSEYLVLTGFAYRKHPLKGSYNLAKFEDRSAVGASNHVYTAKVPVLGRRYITEKTYELTLTTPVFPGAKQIATLLVDGVQFGNSFEFEYVAQTE